MPAFPGFSAFRTCSRYSWAPIRAPRSIATPLDDVPGDWKFEDTALPSVAASIRAGTRVACSTLRPRVLAIIVWPLIRAPGP